MDCLPNELLVQILSFLPTKQAATTSVLSKRWRTLFAFSPNLDFDDSILLHPEEGKHQRGDIKKIFEDFVDNTLALQGCNHLKTFSLKFQQHYGDAQSKESFNRWICNALEHCVSELHVAIKSLNNLPLNMFYLPSNVFTSTTLVKLSLGTEKYIAVLPSVYLPALKVLLLDTVWFMGDQLSNLFLPACPVLEDLTIFHRSYPRVLYAISSKTIKRVSVIYNCEYMGYDSCIISLDTPNIAELYYSDYARKKYPHCNLDSLVKATLDLYFFKEYDDRNKHNDVTDLINGIRNVKTLHLTFSAVEVIWVCCKGGLPVFENLVDLVFSSKNRGSTKLLPLLLERSPNLKNLVLSGLNCYTFNRKHRFAGTPNPPNNQIKMLSIMQYEGSVNELKHLSNFLLNMKHLEVVKVYVAPSVDDSKKMQVTEDLLKLPTASSKLKIQIM